MPPTRPSLTLLVLISFCGISCHREDPASRNSGGQGGPGISVVASRVRMQPVAETQSFVGTVVADEVVQIKAETPGVVEKILFQEGQRVQKGDVLIRLDQSKLQAALEEAKADLELSKATFARDRQLLEDKLISKQEFDQAGARFQADDALVALRERQLEDTRITAQFSGVVGARRVSPGQVISREETLTWLVDLNPVKVEFNVPENFLSACRKDQKIRLSVAAYPDRDFPGQVYFVAPFLDQETRTVQVKARVPNPDRLLKPGMFANLDLTVTIRTNALVIPETALYRMLEHNQAMVYKVDAARKAQLATVTLGERMASKVEVRAGLRKGELVIVEGTQKIAPGSPVKVVKVVKVESEEPQEE